MVRSLGVVAASAQADAVRRRLAELDLLRSDLKVARRGADVVFPVVDTCGPRLPTVEFDFEPRAARPARYADLLPWPEEERERAPRAFDRFGDIAVVKVPDDLLPRAGDVGAAMLRFLPGCRAVFQDRGVKGPFRVRDLVRIAGGGDSATTLTENGVRLVVDPGRAYYSPRLADERARIVGQIRGSGRPEHVVDLFGGVAALGVQAARAGTTVDTVDLNPDAVALARENVARNGVADRVRVHLGDAREVARGLPPADRVVMNLPHGAWDFLDAALPLVRPGGLLHYHEILEEDDVAARGQALLAEAARLGRRARLVGTREVRAYSATSVHVVFDLEVA